MSFLANAWYMAAWASEVTRTPLARTILGQPTVFYRREDTTIVALDDICPHRFAPLHKGQLFGDHIRCPYHGLRFSPDGACVAAPGGPTPETTRTRVFPVAERDGIVWVWPGEPTRAAAAPVPDHPEMADREGAAVQRGGYLHVRSDYRLVADNLLDLSHAEFLHPFLGNPGSVDRTTFWAEEAGEGVIARSHLRGEPTTGLVRALWEGERQPDLIDMIIDVHWRAPADMRLDIRSVPLDGAPGELFTSGPHIVTPETEASCHYFFGNSRNMKLIDPVLDQIGVKGLGLVFENEDVPMIEAQERYRAIAQGQGRRMRSLKLDEAVLKANKILDRRIAAEMANAPPAPEPA